MTRSANQQPGTGRSPYLMVHSDGYSQAVVGDARIKVIGVGGGGGNALNRMIQGGLQVRAYMGLSATEPSASMYASMCAALESLCLDQQIDVHR